MSRVAGRRSEPVLPPSAAERRRASRSRENTPRPGSTRHGVSRWPGLTPSFSRTRDGRCPRVLQRVVSSLSLRRILPSENPFSGNLAEGGFGYLVIVGLSLAQVAFPTPGGPDLEMVPHAQEDDLATQFGQLSQLGRDPNATLPVQLDLLRSSVEQPSKLRGRVAGWATCRPADRPAARSSPPCKSPTIRPCRGRHTAYPPDGNPPCRGDVWGWPPGVSRQSTA